MAEAKSRRDAAPRARTRPKTDDPLADGDGRLDEEDRDDAATLTDTEAAPEAEAPAEAPRAPAPVPRPTEEARPPWRDIRSASSGRGKGAST